MQTGYAVEIRHEALGAAPAKLELVYVLSDSLEGAARLVRTGLRLDDQPVRVLRVLGENEVKTLGLKPFQVKHG